ncbi:MAG: hypothetical protein OIN66_06515 [Candidatus Methanoperedens sp.]|nr:hypothetical protein [Candidatus Methanoperedens sp.]
MSTGWVMPEAQYKKPQINADERRYNPVTGYFWTNTVTEFSKTTPCKEKSQCRTRMTRIRRIFTDTIDPCLSVSSVQSVFYCCFAFCGSAAN